MMNADMQNKRKRVKADTPFCLQYSTSVQQSSFLTTSAGQLRLGVIADMDEVTTTRRTPSSFAAMSTLFVPLIAGANSSFCQYMDQVKMSDNYVAINKYM